METHPSPTVTRDVHLAVYETMADWEIGHAVAHINSTEFQKQPGRFRVVTVSGDGAVVRTKGGVAIMPDRHLAELTPERSALLILPGSDHAASGGIEPFVRLARQFLEAGIPVAAICGATAALARAGLLDTRAHTSNAPDFLATTGYRGGHLYVDAPAVTDGDLITASGIAPVEFAHEIIARLDLYTESTLDAWFRLYRNQDPSGYRDLMAEHFA